MSTNPVPLLHVEVAYALPARQQVYHLAVTPDSTVEAIIRQSGVLETFPEIDLAVNKVGIYSRTVQLAASVQDGDRIEIYRPLIADPKEIRRKRAAQAAAAKEAAKESDQ
ncbi:hypothetical protein VST7929_00635 [Vibrio stylophorae]|uniref:UPF0125 protein VST7929_00635 n=1 Tax=Vibrio stylophorae TaxID=659351 RepID=A0ABN8DQZ0_9VIBR|nr:RnfH family protein [Vibrio stylophorae]CAH0532788.1 hypothetical protein VST7929_00635 [Vibrio stylophorae]